MHRQASCGFTSTVAVLSRVEIDPEVTIGPGIVLAEEPHGGSQTVAKAFDGVINIDVTQSISDWGPMVDESGTPFVDLAMEVKAAYARD